MASKNPYTISFGKIPGRFISRNVIIDSIIEALDDGDEQAFKLTGIRGTGKTVTLSAIEKRLREEGEWIVVGLTPDSDIISDLVAELYSSIPFIADFIDAELNLSVFGIGLNLSKKKPVASMNYALKQLLKEVRKKNKKLLVTIDEARKTPEISGFIQEFQLLIREELPIYVVVAGLYEDIESIENSDGMTFFLRAAKYEMTPLNITYIRDDYQKTLGISRDEADKLAFLTKGYAYAYQVLGKYMYESESKTLNESVLHLLDETLSEKVYKKIWSELAPNDKMFMKCIVQKDRMSTSELLEMSHKTHSEWSVPRNRLKEKGIIDTATRGMVSVRLPRFKEFIDSQFN